MEEELESLIKGANTILREKEKEMEKKEIVLEEKETDSPGGEGKTSFRTS